MERLLTDVILVDHKFQAISNCFLVEITAHNIIYDLKRKVKEKRHNDLSHFDILNLTVWKMKGEMTVMDAV